MLGPSRTKVLLALALVAFAAVLASGCGSGAKSHQVTLGARIGDMSKLPGIHLGDPPWPAETAHLKQRLDVLGLPALAQEALAFHIHAHLDLYADGTKETVPTNAGINFQAQFIAPLHTHDSTGVIHVESPIEYDYTLGQFFGVWGLRLSRTCVGGLCNSGAKTLKVWVDGKPFAGDPTRIVLEAHEEIVVAYGTPAELPNPIPSKYSFPSGL